MADVAEHEIKNGNAASDENNNTVAPTAEELKAKMKASEEAVNGNGKAHDNGAEDANGKGPEVREYDPAEDGEGDEAVDDEEDVDEDDNEEECDDDEVGDDDEGSGLGGEKRGADDECSTSKDADGTSAESSGEPAHKQHHTE